MNKINGRTLEEIKKGLECYITQNTGRCEGILCRECSHFDPNSAYTITACKDALALIQQLERERDAAVKDLKSVVASNCFDGDYCKLCKYNEPDGQCHHPCVPYSSKWGWQWRGVQEVE